MALLHSAAARLLPYGGVRQRQGFGIGPSFGPSSSTNNIDNQVFILFTPQNAP